MYLLLSINCLRKGIRKPFILPTMHQRSISSPLHAGVAEHEHRYKEY